MTKLLYYIIGILVAVGGAACGREEPAAPEPVTPVRKTVLVYMPWSAGEGTTTGSLYDHFLRNIADIERAIVAEGTLGGTRLLVAIANDYHHLDLIEVSLAGGACRRDTLQAYTSPQYSSGQWLVTLFNQVATTAPAATYALIVGAHGTGWLPPGSRPHRSRAFGGRTASTQADVTTLAAAIAASRLRHLQFVCFDDCYMANVETAYALREVTDRLIASTSEVMDAGLPYADAWPHLYAEPDYRAVCDLFLQFYNRYRMPYGTLSVIDCTVMDSLAAAMLAANDAVDGSAPEGVQALDGFGKTVFYDMGDYVARACGDAAAAAAVKAALDRAVVATCCTPALYSVYLDTYDRTFFVNTTCGLTISDPTVNEAALPTLRSTAWWRATHR